MAGLSVGRTCLGSMARPQVLQCCHHKWCNPAAVCTTQRLRREKRGGRLPRALTHACEHPRPSNPSAQHSATLGKWSHFKSHGHACRTGRGGSRALLLLHEGLQARRHGRRLSGSQHAQHVAHVAQHLQLDIAASKACGLILLTDVVCLSCLIRAVDMTAMWVQYITQRPGRHLTALLGCG